MEWTDERFMQEMQGVLTKASLELGVGRTIELLLSLAVSCYAHALADGQDKRAVLMNDASEMWDALQKYQNSERH